MDFQLASTVTYGGTVSYGGPWWGCRKAFSSTVTYGGTVSYGGPCIPAFLFCRLFARKLSYLSNRLSHLHLRSKPCK
uniref:Uncharacterized protein n=1 Tax=Helianthus annuus TaxID=4232 RepID=A0A251T1M3_HELAN